MDTRDGRIYTNEEIRKMGKVMKDAFSSLDFIKRMEIPPTEEQLKRTPPKVNLDEHCPCGSGKIFMVCCYNPLHENCL